MALIGGVGGTLTIFCYGYWIREKGRVDDSAVGLCRLDLLVGYSVTVLFGLAMVIVGNSIEVEGKGTSLLIQLAGTLELSLGVTGRWVFLIGAFCAVFSSLLGVWQAVPYLFADVWQRMTGVNTPLDRLRQTLAYQLFLFAIAFVPMLGLLVSFKEIQKLYSVVGTFFMPLLAVALLIFNGRAKWLASYRNGWLSQFLLVATLGFFTWLAWLKLAA